MASVSEKLQILQTGMANAGYAKVPGSIAFFGGCGVDNIGELNDIRSDARKERTVLNAFSQGLNQTVQEQNEYVIEIENFQDELEKLQDNYSKEVASSENKYFELKEKELEGTITDSEKQELSEIETKNEQLKNDTNSKMGSLSSALDSSRQKLGNITISGNTSGIIEKTNGTIGSLQEWNQKNSDKKIAQILIKGNEFVCSDLDSLANSVDELSKKYQSNNSLFAK